MKPGLEKGLYALLSAFLRPHFSIHETEAPVCRHFSASSDIVALQHPNAGRRAKCLPIAQV